MKTILDLLLAVGMKRVANGKDGPEFHGPHCPACGTGDDRFIVWSEHPKSRGGGRFLCRQCGRTGDGVSFLVDLMGWSLQAAREALGVNASGAEKIARQVKSIQKFPDAVPDEKQQRTAKLAEQMRNACKPSAWGHRYLSDHGIHYPIGELFILTEPAMRLYAAAMGQNKLVRDKSGRIGGIEIASFTFRKFDLFALLTLPDETIHGAQLINSRGDKALLPGTQAKGLSFHIEGDTYAPMNFGEGIANSLNVRRFVSEAADGSLRLEGVAVISAGNWVVVAEAWRKFYPNRPFFFFPDNDTHLPNNPGLNNAIKAARLVGNTRIFIATSHGFKEVAI